MIDVIIPFFNRPEYTQAILYSLYSIDHGTPIAPIIVDNASRKRSKEVVSEWKATYANLSNEIKAVIAEPRIVELEANTGFAGAVNAALSRFTPSEYVVIMHNDCIPLPGWAGELLDCFKSTDDETAVMIPRTCYANEQGPCLPDIRKKFEEVKPSNKDRITADQVMEVIEKLYPNRNAFVESLKQAQQRMVYCPEIASFCMMTRSAMFQKYGKFDEDFWPRGWEDKFWFRPLERDGYVCMIASHAYVHHFGNITSDGPGFSFPESFKLNQEKFKAKCLENDMKPRPQQPVNSTSV